jgi:polysaccharide biosynthesis protein PelD
MRIEAIRNILWEQKPNGLTVSNLLEAIIITSLPFCIGFWFNPSDPFFLRVQFPILLIPPFLLALRYGLTHGMASFAMILLGVTGAFYYQIGGMQTYPGELIFGILFCTLVAGEMTNHSLKEIRCNQAKNKFLKIRFGEFTNAYHIMKVSHDQLKEQLANAKFSLREALQMVREKLQKQYKDGNFGLNYEAGGELISIFNYFCATQIAGVYKMDETGAIDRRPVAVQGNMGELKANDQLILRAIEQGTLVSVLPEMYVKKSNQELETDLLVVVPIKDASGKLWGIFAVAEMQFTAFQDEILNLMQLIGSYTGDLLNRAENVFYSKNAKQAFIGELRSIWRMAREFRITSSIIFITFKETITSNDYMSAIINRIRGLDQAWVFSDEKERPVLCLLIPLMVKNEYLSFQESLDAFFKDRFGHNLKEAGGSFYHREISENNKFFDYLSFVADHTKESTCSLPSDDFIFQYDRKVANLNSADEKEKDDSVNNFKCLEKNDFAGDLFSINFQSDQ